MPFWSHGMATSRKWGLKNFISNIKSKLLIFFIINKNFATNFRGVTIFQIINLFIYCLLYFSLNSLRNTLCGYAIRKSPQRHSKETKLSPQFPSLQLSHPWPSLGFFSDFLDFACCMLFSNFYVRICFQKIFLH